MRAFRIIGCLLVGACTPLPHPRVVPAPIANSTANLTAPRTASSLSTAMDAEAAARGATIARASCAGCHAIEAAGASPMAIAPPFRAIVRHRSSDDLAAAFERGLVTTHPAMPPYVFRANEIHDLTAYLDTLRDGVDRRAMP